MDPKTEDRKIFGIYGAFCGSFHVWWGLVFFYPKEAVLQLAFCKSIFFFLFTFAPKYDTAHYRTSARGNKSKFIIPKPISLPFRSVCQCLALSPPWLWDSPFSQGLETFKWEASEHSQAAAVG